MADYSTKFVQLRGFIEWPQLFEDNRDTTSTHKGKDKQLKACGGEYKVNFYPLNAEELQKAKESGLSEDLYGGGKRFKSGSDLGEGVFFKLARKHIDRNEVTQKDGTVKVYDNGGPPELVWFNEERGYNTPFVRETDGMPANGTEVVVKFSVYGEGTGQTVRLLKIGVINLKTYDPEGSDDQGIRF